MSFSIKAFNSRQPNLHNYFCWIHNFNLGVKKWQAIEPISRQNLLD